MSDDSLTLVKKKMMREKASTLLRIQLLVSSHVTTHTRHGTARMKTKMGIGPRYDTSISREKRWLQKRKKASFPVLSAGKQSAHGHVYKASRWHMQCGVQWGVQWGVLRQPGFSEQVYGIF